MSQRSGLCLLLSWILAACAPQVPSTETSPEQSICVGYGFTLNTDAFASCSARVSHLLLEYEENDRRCEGVRQQTLRTLPSGAFSRGLGTAVLDAEAAYRLCLSEHLPSPVKLELPSGQSVTCEQIENHIRCD